MEFLKIIMIWYMHFKRHQNATYYLTTTIKLVKKMVN